MAALLATQTRTHTHTHTKSPMITLCEGGGIFVSLSFQRVQGSAFISVFAFHSNSVLIAFADTPKNFAVVFCRMAGM